MYEAKKFDSIRQLDGFSEKTLTEHYKLYEGYVKKYNEISDRLNTADRAAANQVFSDYRALKTELSFAIGGIKNHEIYFDHLGGNGNKPSGKLAEQINEDFGSFEKWQEDMKATAMAARGWAWLVCDHDFKKLMNVLGDSQNTYSLWNATPILALDTYEHAYFLDFGVKRADYVETFFKNLNWSIIEKNFEQATG